MTSADEKIAIPKHHALDEITSIIRMQESMGFLFNDSTLERDDQNQPYNRVTFQFYLDGFPRACVVAYASAAVPAGHAKEWGGQMYVQNNPREVVLYRQQAEAAKIVPGMIAALEGVSPRSATVDSTAAEAATSGRRSAAQVLQLGSKGPAVKQWQLFLLGQGFDVLESGVFDQRTHDGTEAFQRKHGLHVDGVVGNESYGQAALLGFELVDYVSNSGSGYPPEPSFRPVLDLAQRQALFGAFEYRSSPQPENPEHITILGNWVDDNIVTIELPQLQGIQGALRGNRVQVHQRAVEPMRSLWAAWKQAGLLDRILTWDGAFSPRFIRGSLTTLSNHAFGSAFDINAATNPRGVEPAWPGKPGCVFELIPLAHAHGFYWGGHFKTRRDGMHFELSVP